MSWRMQRISLPRPLSLFVPIASAATASTRVASLFSIDPMSTPSTTDQEKVLPSATAVAVTATPAEDARAKRAARFGITHNKAESGVVKSKTLASTPATVAPKKNNLLDNLVRSGGLDPEKLRARQARFAISPEESERRVSAAIAAHERVARTAEAQTKREERVRRFAAAAAAAAVSDTASAASDVPEGQDEPTGAVATDAEAEAAVVEKTEEATVSE
ncbi:hypothetical protein H696_04533 [Fonticula alba]|uniref:Uncharacterized protein n=1 Tax=Fonticula alba TaxID=691883 RepID=A0A058Z6G2_FONAL|nr:hypothetical protein H696_04533 [Fonticula alba]KCV69117.1 hypothetical protein H696_04533 [Fonticula alba]|eukprot:XP_009496688.1 hypothetical protein H696_04533 [Fonticula alba]